MIRRYANITNGLCFPPYHDVCHFMSSHGHSFKIGYLRLDSMPYSAVIHLLKGHTIQIVDATQHAKPLTDALKYGLITWCLIFNRAIGFKNLVVAKWETPEMRKAAHYSDVANKIKQRIRRLESVFGNKGPVIIGKNVLIKCHRNFKYDDKPTEMRRIICTKESAPFNKFLWNSGRNLEMSMFEDRASPDPGEHDKINCEICGTEHDKFTCPNIEEKWHKQAKAIKKLIRATPSSEMAFTMELEVARILRNKQHTKESWSL